MEENDVMVSVIVLTYNHEKYIRQALDSILLQEVDFKYEILVGDDASTDTTAVIIRDYAHRYSEIVKATIRGQNLGATRNLYDLQTRAQGKYLAYLEGDDYWCDRKKLAQQVSFMRSHDDYIACTHFCHVVAENGERLPKKSIPWIAKKQKYRLSDFQGVVLPGHISTLLHRNIFEHGGEDYRRLIECNPLIGDRSLMLLLAAKGAIYQIPRYMSCYRWRQSDNATTVAYEKNAACIIDDYLYTKRLEERATEMNIDGGFQAHYRDLFTSAVWRMICKPTRGNWAIVKMIAKEGNLFAYVAYLPVGVMKKVANKWRKGR